MGIYEAAHRHGNEFGVPGSGTGMAETYDAPCALDAELDAERTGSKATEARRQDPKRDKCCMEDGGVSTYARSTFAEE